MGDELTTRSPAQRGAQTPPPAPPAEARPSISPATADCVPNPLFHFPDAPTAFIPAPAPTATTLPFTQRPEAAPTQRRPILPWLRFGVGGHFLNLANPINGEGLSAGMRFHVSFAEPNLHTHFNDPFFHAPILLQFIPRAEAYVSFNQDFQIFSGGLAVHIMPQDYFSLYVNTQGGASRSAGEMTPHLSAGIGIQFRIYNGVMGFVDGQYNFLGRSEGLGATAGFQFRF